MGVKRNIQRIGDRCRYNLYRLYLRATTGKWPVQIVFIHVPKTAGSSVQTYFASFIGSSRKNQIVRFDTLYEDAPEEIVRLAKEARYVGGHIDWKIFEAISKPDTFLFTILREPVDRFLSSYYYLQQFPSHYTGYEFVKHIRGMSFEDFCTTSDFAVRAFTDNVLSRQLSGDLRFFPESEDMLGALTEKAISHLSRFNYIGFQDDFEGALRTISQKAKLPLPAKIPRENITKKSASDSTQPRITRADVLRLASTRLQGDMKIYQAAQQLFAKEKIQEGKDNEFH